MEVSDQLHASGALLPRIQSSVSFGLEAGWALKLISTLCRRENLLSLPGIESCLLGLPIHNLVTTISNELKDEIFTIKISIKLSGMKLLTSSVDTI
jgi:hypothetical protein